MCFDATRTINSFGRLINHGLHCEVNIKPHIPVKVGGKWKIGFYALLYLEHQIKGCFANVCGPGGHF